MTPLYILEHGKFGDSHNSVVRSWNTKDVQNCVASNSWKIFEPQTSKFFPNCAHMRTLVSSVI